jgi:hypothetical protein
MGGGAGAYWFVVVQPPGYWAAAVATVNRMTAMKRTPAS